MYTLSRRARLCDPLERSEAPPSRIQCAIDVHLKRQVTTSCHQCWGEQGHLEDSNGHRGPHRDRIMGVLVWPSEC